MEKIFVLDTNVLIHDPLAPRSFKEHRVVIPMTVLEELDAIKDRRDKDVSREARIAIQTIDQIVGDSSPRLIQEGVPIPKATNDQHSEGTLSVYPDQIITNEQHIPFLNVRDEHANDNRIINVALALQADHPGLYVCLVTKDINMRIKAKGSGLEHVEDYRRDKVLDDIDLLAKGHEYYQGSVWDYITEVETVSEGRQTVHYINKGDLRNLYPKTFLQDEQGFIGYVREIKGDKIEMLDLNPDILMGDELWGLKPRNLEQAMAFHAIQDPDVDLSVLTGPAGSGKTLISLAYSLHAIIEEKRFDKLIIARSTPPIAEDIGFLPGTEEEKMAPWLAAFEDNLEVLHSKDDSCTGSIEYVKERANIQFKSLNFMRGRSFNNAMIIIDEAQGLTQFQLKSIITRVGCNSKIIVLGNLAQIDSKYITPLTSGLTYLVEKAKHFRHSAVMHVNGIERSRLAAFAEENL